MKVLNLRCAHDHRFEGWFASEDDFVAQGERGLLACPLCEDATISRLPSAPRLNMSTSRGEAAAPVVSAPTEANPVEGRESRMSQLQGQWLRAMRAKIDATEDVGQRFPEEARRIHYGEAPERAIRGRATATEAEALRDEGIEVVSMTQLAPFKGPVQ